MPQHAIETNHRYKGRTFKVVAQQVRPGIWTARYFGPGLTGRGEGDLQPDAAAARDEALCRACRAIDQTTAPH